MEAAQTPKNRTLSATVDRTSVESILVGHDSRTSMQPPPMEHIGSPKQKRNDESANENGSGYEPPMSPPKSSRSRPNSMIMSSRNKANRSSLSFPVQVSTNLQTNSYTGSGPNSETSTGTLFQSQASSTAGDPPNDFMQELARQERRVFELREELGKAEGELEGLKKKWAFREVHKKRSEIRAVEQMVPYNPKVASAGDDNDGNEVRRSTEMTMDRRKAMLLAGIGRESRRKVMEGRHTRTLSLLSPDRSNFVSNSLPGSATFSNSSNTFNAEGTPISAETATINGCVPLNMGVARSNTLPDLQAHLYKPRNRHSYHNTTATSKNSANEVIKTGKRIAEDLRAGLWTFVEDLRQATVGEEAVNGPTSRTRNPNTNPNTQYVGGTGYGALNSLATSTPKKNVKGKVQGNKVSPVVERDYTRDLHELSPEESLMPDIDGPSTTVFNKRKSITAPTQEDLTADDWLNWDSPASSKNSGIATSEEENQRWSSSTFGTDVGELDDSGLTPNKIHVTIPGSQREGLQWPLLSPFSPSHLKKTAESLMREWEKSLTPPPEEEESVIVAKKGQSNGFEGHDLLR